ncbi:MAG: GntR family transcriptional regulator [Mycetocola sp.]
MGSTSASDRAYEWLRTKIVTGELPAGSFVEEATVSEAAGVSRTPVREAMHRLAGERMIQLVPRRGAQIRDITTREILEAYEARWLIESAAVTSVIARGEDLRTTMEEHLAVMDGLIDELAATGSPAVTARYSAADRAFHREYVSRGGNGLITDFYDTLWPLHAWMSLRTDTYGNAAQVHAQHRTIFEAIVDRDETAALDTLRLHLRPFAQPPHEGLSHLGLSTT